MFKQTQLLFAKSYDDDRKKSFISNIRNNIMLSLYQLASNCAVYGCVSPANEKTRQKILSIEEIDVATIDPELVDDYKAFWADPIVQKTWLKRHEYQIYTNTSYYLDQIETIADKSYIPSQLDILWTRIRTTGIVENQFFITDVDDQSTTQYQLYDVGGQVCL